MIYNDADLKDAGIWALKQKSVGTLNGDSDGVEIDPRLDFRKTDKWLSKKCRLSKKAESFDRF